MAIQQRLTLEEALHLRRGDRVRYISSRDPLHTDFTEQIEQILEKGGIYTVEEVCPYRQQERLEMNGVVTPDLKMKTTDVLLRLSRVDGKCVNRFHYRYFAAVPKKM